MSKPQWKICQGCGNEFWATKGWWKLCESCYKEEHKDDPEPIPWRRHTRKPERIYPQRLSKELSDRIRRALDKKQG